MKTLALYFLSFAFSYTVITNRNLQGEVVIKMRYLNKVTKQKYPVEWYNDAKTLYYDSMIIYEGTVINIHTDVRGVTTRNTHVNKYTFIDLRSKTYTVYKNFADTALVVKHYPHPATGRPEGGFNFISTGTHKIMNQEKLKDTLIGPDVFSRFMVKNNVADKKEALPVIYYTLKQSAAAMPPFFTLLQEYSFSSKLSVLKEEQVLLNDSVNIILEYVHERKKLNREEIAVFKVWKKNLNTLLAKKKEDEHN